MAEDAAAKRVVQQSHVTHFEQKHEEEMKAIRVAEQAAEVVQEEYRVRFHDYESPFRGTNKSFFRTGGRGHSSFASLSKILEAQTLSRGTSNQYRRR